MERSRTTPSELLPGDMAFVEHAADGLVLCHVVAATKQPDSYQVVRTEGDVWRYDMASGPMARATFVPVADCVTIAPYIGVRMEFIRAMRDKLPPHVVRLISLWRFGMANRAAMVDEVGVAAIDACIVCRGTCDLSRDAAADAPDGGAFSDQVMKCVLCLMPSHMTCMQSVRTKVHTATELQRQVEIVAQTRIRYPKSLLHKNLADTFAVCALCELLNTEVGEEAPAS